MELVYMWIGRYGNIIEKGFNFSNVFHLEYDESTLHVHKKRNDAIQIFNDSFLNVVAIAGENGSGKTSLLSFIENFFIPGNIRMDRHVKFAYLNNDGELMIYGEPIENISPHEGAEFKIVEDLKDLQKKVLPLFFSGGIEIRDEEQLGQIFQYLTGEAALRHSQFQVNKMICEEIQSVYEHYDWPNVTEANKNDFNYSIKRIINYSRPGQLYRIAEIKRIIHFICKHNPDEYSFIPRWLNLVFDSSYVNKCDELSEDDHDIIDKLSKYIYTTHPLARNTPEEVKDQFKSSVRIQLFIFLIVCDRSRVNFHEVNIDTAIDQLKVLSSIEEISEYIDSFIKASNFIYSGRRVDFTKLKELNSELNGLIDGIEIFKFDEGSYHLIRDLNSLRFINFYFDFWSLSDFAFFFRFNEMSAGEKALLTLLSRLFSIPEYNQIGSDKTIWLMIDEGELYLHPEWQRNFLFELHKYLPLFYPNNKIQLFITTHSPFVLSDLPKENIMLLERTDSLCKISDMSVIPHTFGANIHELLTSSFFMKNGVIGKFAEDVINDLFKYLNNEEPVREWSKESAFRTIENIGEAIISEQLRLLFEMKFGSTSEIEFIEQQISRLQETLKNKKEGLQDDTN